MSVPRESKRARLSDSEVVALKNALTKRDNFCCGTCVIPDYQRFLYYAFGDLVRRIDLSRAGVDDFEGLYRACKPAECRQDGEHVLDESHGKPGRMDRVSFSTLLDPHGLRIHEQVSKALFTELFATMDMELSELNVYGKGDFCKPRIVSDVPQSQEVFGSLVVVLPSPHEGGQFVLRDTQNEWTVDVGEKVRAASEPLVCCFVAFRQDVKHEVLPVTSGYRVTLTYNLYHQRRVYPGVPTPFDRPVARMLADLVNDTSTLPDGGYLGFGLAYQYAAHARDRDILELLSADQMSGEDRALVDACEALGLRWSFRLIYRDILDAPFDLLTTTTLVVDESVLEDILDRTSTDHLRAAVVGLADEQAEGVRVIRPGKREIDVEFMLDGHEWLERFFKEDQPKRVLEVTKPWQWTRVEVPFIAWESEEFPPPIRSLSGIVWIVVAVEPATSRGVVGL